jgi:glucose dehydrogenase
MRYLWIGLIVVALLGGGIWANNTLMAQRGVAPATTTKLLGTGEDWPRYMGDLAGTRFSRLKQIDTTNVSKLVPAWTTTGVGGETTPIVVSGIMYVGTTGGVVALEADTGKEIWRYGNAAAAGGGRGGGGRGGPGGAGQAPAGAGRGAGAAVGGPVTIGAPSSRGVSYWPGDGTIGPRIFFTSGRRIAALNALTGALDTAFGQAGSVDMGVNWGGVPTVFRNMLFAGASNGEVPTGPSPGDTKAFDARTGAKLWDFKTVAQPGDPNHATWLDDGWKDRQGVNQWGWYLTVDEDRGYLYTSLGAPAANYYGGDRPGTNLYANSVVAIDATTGKYVWHYQTVHHDLWDSDQPSSPTLLDIQQNGRTIPALGLIGKTGWLFILDRTNGKPVFGVEERPVTKGNVPGEWYSPTQPFPVKPPALVRTSFKKEDLVTAADTTPEHAAACQALYERVGGLYNVGPFTPFLFHESVYDDKGQVVRAVTYDPKGTPKTTINFPGNGGANWGGPAADPTMGYIFAFTQDAAITGWMEKKEPGGNYGNGTQGSNQPYDRGSVTGPGPYSGFAAGSPSMPCQKPPWGRLTAVNANTGNFAWQIPLGVSDNLPEGKQNTGKGGSAGPIVTAGGLVFIGAASDSRFRAIESKTGKELWVVRMNASGGANPMTYQAKNGKQYVAQAAGGTLNVYTLP